jgi:hypothetical protein
VTVEIPHSYNSKLNLIMHTAWVIGDLEADHVTAVLDVVAPLQDRDQARLSLEAVTTHLCNANAKDADGLIGAVDYEVGLARLAAETLLTDETSAGLAIMGPVLGRLRSRRHAS